MITLSKIAKLASVSVSTASKAFSMSREVNEETREAIFRIAREHGCFKKFYNAKYPKLVIAVICPELHSPHYSDFLERIRILLEEKNCEVCVASTNFSELNAFSLMDYYSRYAAVDGAIVFGSLGEKLAEIDIPVVSLSNTLELDGIGAALSYNDGISESVEYLLSHGVNDIGFIGESHTNQKLALFKDALERSLRAVDEERVVVTDERFELSGYIGARRLVERRKPPRAIVCAYDSIAVGAMRALSELGYSVPDDVAIIGMDNMPFCSFTTPSISSVSLDNGDICKYVTETIVNLLRGEDYEKRKSFGSKLVLRESSVIK